RAPGRPIFAPASLANIALIGPAAMGPEELIDWLQTAMDVFQSAASSRDFFRQAADALVTMVGLDTGGVLTTPDQEAWETAAVAAAPRTNLSPLRQGEAGPDWEPSRKVLSKVCEEKRTFWQVP